MPGWYFGIDVAQLLLHLNCVCSDLMYSTDWGCETSFRKWNRGCNGLHQLGQPVAPSILFPGRRFISPVCMSFFVRQKTPHSKLVRRTCLAEAYYISLGLFPNFQTKSRVSKHAFAFLPPSLSLSLTRRNCLPKSLPRISIPLQHRLDTNETATNAMQYSAAHRIVHLPPFSLFLSSSFVLCTQTHTEYNVNCSKRD